MNFGEALAALKDGKKVARAGWNGKNLWIRLVPGDRGGQPTYPCRPYVEMKDAQDYLVPWLASQTDLLAEDWSTVL